MYTRILAAAFAAACFHVPGACFAGDGPAHSNDQPAAVLPAGAAAPRYVFHEGEALDYTIKLEQHTRLPSGTADPDFVLSSVVTFDTVWTVRAVKANRDAEMELAVKRFVFSADAPMIVKITADSDKAPDPANKPAASVYQVLSAMQKGASRVSVTPSGKVASFQWQKEAEKALADDDAGELKGFFGDLFSAAGAQGYLTAPIAIVPAEVLKPGGEWKSAAVVFGLQCQDIYRIAPAQSDAAEKGIVKFTIATQLESQGEGKSDLGVGTMKFDIAHNRLVALQRRHDLPIAGAGGGHTDATITVTFKEK